MGNACLNVAYMIKYSVSHTQTQRSLETGMCPHKHTCTHTKMEKKNPIPIQPGGKLLCDYDKLVKLQLHQ